MFKIINSKLWLFAVIIAVSMIGCGSNDNGSDPISVIDALGTSGDVKSAAGYAILAKTAVDTIPTSIVTGNVGLSPHSSAGGLTGWSETEDVTFTYSTSDQVVSPFKLYAANYSAGTTAADLTAAVHSMETAYTAAAGLPAGVGPFLNTGTGTLTDRTLAPGIYTWGSNVSIPTDLTLNGSATDMWVFQITGNLSMAGAKNVILSGGALPENIIWQVAGNVNIGAGSHFKGIILCMTDITFGNLSSIDGRLLAQTAVNIDATTVTQP